MQSLRIDPTESIEGNINRYLEQGDRILHVFEVIPLDYRIADFLTPKFHISNKKLFFIFDEVMEIYDLENLEISMIGQSPFFDIIPLLFEQTFIYSFENRRKLDEIKDSETVTRLSINDYKAVPKYFLLRKDFKSAKSLQTWALTQLLINIKMGKVENPDLIEILSGYFSSFNQKTVLYFIFVFLGYVGLRFVASYLPSIFSTILDVIFGIILVLLGIWTYISVNRNLQKYKNIYSSYSSPN